MSDDAEFKIENTDAGASLTYPMEAGKIRKGGHIVIKGRPCKVVDVSTSKTGKHGHAKANFVAIDLFTGKKLEDIVPTSHNAEVPNVDRTEYDLIDIDEDGALSLMDDKGETRDDLNLPKDDELAKKVKELWDTSADVGVICVVLKAMGEETVIDARAARN
eukprot:CAMPEP_0113881216 /NCGR_PEP_ID=MMETSP0780_2-20120614/8242_1 /TAXON_ID=652834 /ORGANISM="Palpitomonas bilix" /LENGTH=160 /DNA_ID=CAMNT_0000868027 /DNA_START=82 /DNA_END=567 /DNA_ORIENTATION=+ /assembly_acc=CAM_ASM_000599